MLWPLFFAFLLIKRSEGTMSQPIKETCLPTNANPEFSICAGFSEKIQEASAEAAKDISRFSGFIPILNSALYYRISISNKLSSNLRIQVDKPEQSATMQPDILCDYNGGQHQIAPNDTAELASNFNPLRDTLSEIKCLTGFRYSSTKQMIVAPLEKVSAVIFDGTTPEVRGEFKFNYKLRRSSKVLIYIGILLFWFGILTLLRNAILFFRKGFKFFIE